MPLPFNVACDYDRGIMEPIDPEMLYSLSWEITGASARICGPPVGHL